MIESSYLFSLVLGGIVLAFSIFADGESDKDFDFDSDLDVDADLDLEMDVNTGLDQNLLEDSKRQKGFKISWLPLLSMRFWTFGLASYGGLGMALTGMGKPPLIVFTASLVTGFVVGWVAAQLFKALKLSSSNSAIDTRQLNGNTGKVLLPISPNQIGKIRLIVDGQVLDFLAQSQETILIGEEIMLVNMVEDKAIVAKLAALTGPTHTTDT